MQKLLAYLLTPVYYLFFGLCLLVFHPIQWISLRYGGYNAHKKSVDYLNFCLTKLLLILGNRVVFDRHSVPMKTTPAIIVANHQSMNDIPPIIWHLRDLHPKFISKVELGKGIPSVSFNLRHGGSVLINRKDPVQAINEIKKIALYAAQHHRSVVIFPEGTRSRAGSPKTFQRKGLQTLIENMPGAVIIPISISGSWKTLRYGKYPMGIGNTLRFEVHSPIPVQGKTTEELIDTTELIIKEALR